jgi:AcrR family transcriptional regulator
MAAGAPRRRDADATRTRILEAAQRAFSETGYCHTGIREIASIAGVSSTLLLRYFGSKAGLFESALRAAMPVEATIAGPRGALGKSLAAALLDPANSIRPPLMIALASGDPEAALIAARVFESHSIAPVAAWLGGSYSRARAFELAMLATGLVFYLRQLPLDPLTDAERDHITHWFEDAVERIVET